MRDNYVCHMTSEYINFLHLRSFLNSMNWNTLELDKMFCVQEYWFIYCCFLFLISCEKMTCECKSPKRPCLEKSTDWAEITWDVDQQIEPSMWALISLMGDGTWHIFWIFFKKYTMRICLYKCIEFHEQRVDLQYTFKNISFMGFYSIRLFKASLFIKCISIA